MAVNKGEIGVYGLLRRDGGNGMIAKTDLLLDEELQNTLAALNLGIYTEIGNLNLHVSNTSNPHSVTKEQVGLGSVTNDAQVKRTEMGVALGVATLDGTGKVPSSLLPSYVDDVLEYENVASFPKYGETGKIYVDTTANLTYRWTGTQYTEISKSIGLGETSSTAYAGDKGKAVTDGLATHISDKSNPHEVTKAQVGLGNVDNTSDANKPISTATQTALNNKVDKVTGKGLSTNDYTTAEKTKLSSLILVEPCTSAEISALFE